MGKLSVQELPKKLERPRLASELEEIRKHDDRVRFHTEPTSSTRSVKYYQQYLNDFVSRIIDEKKFEVFKHLMTLPIETVDFTDSLVNELKKALAGQDKTISFQTTTKEIAADFSDYLKGIKDDYFWKTEGVNAMKSNINSILVVDLPALEPDEKGNLVQKTKYPAPYYYLLCPTKLVDAEVNRDGSIEWIIFRDEDDETQLFAFDEDSFRSFKVDGNKIVDGTLIEVPHALGFCPAHTFWSTPFNSASKLQRKSPFSNSLSKLDWLLFTYTSSKHLSLYAGFPIYVMYEQRCTYRDDDGNACDRGKVSKSVRDGNTENFTTVIKDCPSCKNKTLLGPGSVLTAPAPAEQGDPDLLQGVNVIPAEVDSLNWMQSEINRQEMSCTMKIIGYSRELNDAAKNELQINSGFESRLNVVIWIKEQFETAHKFVLDTMGKLRYGASYMGSSVSYGTKFYLYEFMDILDEFQKSKTAGLGVSELHSQFEEMIAVKYQSSPDMYERMRILTALEPFVIYSLSDVKNFPGTTDDRLIELKKNFIDYVSKFESEYTSVVSFMPFGSFEDKIAFIKVVLMKYVDENIAAIKVAQPDPAVDPKALPFN